LLAEELGIPCVSFAEGFEPGPTPGTVRVKRQTDSGFEVIEAATPLVVTITNHDKNVPRIPKTRDVMQSYRKPLEKWSLADLGVDAGTAHAYSRVAELFIPRKETQCEFVEGDTLEAKIDGFARRVTDVLRSM
jgi:electron transfer flavoprotein beta subunit